MRRTLALAGLAAALSLGACAENEAADETAADETTVTETVAVPAATETTVVREGETVDGDRVSIGEDGVEADVNDGDTRVRADVDDDPSLTVETD